jgi:GTP pyrophosphokinase
MDMAKRLTEPTIPSREEFFHRLKQHATRNEVKLVGRVWNFAENHHRGTPRDSQDPYFTHPVSVAWSRMNEFECYHVVSIILDLLHDTLEPDGYSGHVTYKQLRSLFGEAVADKVYAVTHKRQHGNKKEPLPKYIKRFSAEWETLLTKLLDRLHNMRTLYHCKEDKQLRKATETRNCYVPLCHKLEQMLPEEYKHIAPRLKRELEHECAKYL